MAHFTRTCLVFVLLFLSYELVCIEGRGLKASSTKSPESVPVKPLSTTKGGVVANPSQFQTIAKALNGYVDAFRPTTPGHSPGVGHSVNN
uniref:Uncharacterized protein n=1 Tax=Cajanus cajan TaxID=3821 RepID=A0A151TII5_CAJCA|nr:hypothetical protein KK1_013172 [Cajanus cajan]